MEQSYSIAARLRAQATARPQAPALTADDVTYTYGELDLLADRAAHALRAAGVGPGDRVAYLGPNSAHFAALMYGASRLRAASMAVNWRLSPTEITGVLDDAAPVTLLRTPDHAHLPGLSTENWLDGTPIEPVDLPPEPGDLAMLCYTSGTTGRPKGVMASNESIVNHLRRGAYPYVSAGSVMLNCSPVFHAAGAGWLWVPGYFGAHVVLLAQATPAAILSAITEHRVTTALLVPAVIRLLLDDPALPDADVSSLRTIVYGASPITETVLNRAIEAFSAASFVQTYGMTETTGPITRLDEEDHRDRALLRSAGRPYEGIEVRVTVPGTDEPCPDGVPGEVRTRSDQNSPGYWRAGPVTTGEGWLATGDAGYLRDGLLYLTDRIKDMIVTGGENVYAGEVENVLASCPGVRDVCVVGVPHERWGETVAAVIVGDAEPADVIAYARERLAHFKCPTVVEVTGELPRNPSGKVLRRLVREPYWNNRARYVN